MSRKVEACQECTRRCLHLHRKTRNLSSVASFFKVMFGDRFSQVLFFPPMFAARVSMLVNKKIVLEDCLGQQWKVTVSKCEGSLAFQEGWSAFSLDHSVEVGDILTFNHVKDLLFNVTIYTKTGCEKVEFAKKENMRKRIRSDGPIPILKTTNEGLTKPQGSCPSVGSGFIAALSQDKYCMTGSRNVTVNRVKRPKHEINHVKRPKHEINDEWHGPLCRTDVVDDSYCFINRSKDAGMEENGRLLIDLFSMEMPTVNSCINVSTTHKADGDELNLNFASTLLNDAIDVSPVKNAQVDIKGEMEVLPLNLSANEIIDKTQCFEEADIKMSVSDNDPPCHNKTIEVPFTTSPTNSDGNIENFCDTPLIMVNDCQNVSPICDTRTTITRQDQNSIKKPTFPTNHRHRVKLDRTPNSLEVKNPMRGDVTKKIKTEPVDIKIEVNSYEDLLKKIFQPKVEEAFREKSYQSGGDDNRVTNNADSIATPAHISCIVAKDTQSFLELSTSLPFPCSRGRRNSEKRKLVLLRDSMMRLWPVIYLEKPNVHVLTSGWKAFCSENYIEPGDECLFRVEDEFEHIFRVSVRKLLN